MTHKFMKMGGVKTEKEFYKKYPTEEHFFAAFPHMREGGTPTKGQWDFPSDPSTPGYEDYGEMYSVPQYPGLMYKDPTGNAGWEGFGNPANLASNQGIQDMGYGPVRDMPTQQLGMNPSDYSIDKLRASQMKDGGYSNPPSMYWNGTSYVKAKGTGTYANGAYFKDGGKFNYNPFIRKNGNYWKYLDYIEDDGNIAELKQGGPIGYVPASINAQPQILKQTDGVYHMAHGGPIEYIPAPMTVQPQILKRTNGVAHMKEGGIDNPGFRALPVAVQEKIKARMEFGGVHMPTPMKKDGGYWKYYGYDEDAGNIAELAQGGPTDYADEQSPQYKKGGIHIKPENRGKFTAYKKRTGKTTEEALHSPDPHVRQMANFARNAAKWKHEYGGPAIMEKDGYVNPFSTIAQFANGGVYEMQGGGAWGSSSMSNSNNLGFNPVAEANKEAIKETELTQDQKPKVTPPRANMNETPFDASTLKDPYAAEEEQMLQAPVYMRTRPRWGAAALNGLAIGAGIVSAANRKKEIASNNINTGGSWNMPFTQGSKGNDYNVNRMSQPGAVISQPGNFAPYRAQMGGMMSRNNMYQQGGVYDMDEAEIADLISKGYKVQYV